MSFVNSGGVLNTGVQVIQTSAPSDIVAVSPLAPNQVLGNDGAGNIASATLVAGANMTITQTGDQLELASTGGGGSTVGVADGIYSPVQIAFATLSADVPITVAFTSETPALSAMQTIATVSIVSRYGGNGVEGSIQAYCVPSFECPSTQALGVQFCLYLTSAGFDTPVTGAIGTSAGIGSGAYSNSTGVLVQSTFPSVIGETFTFTLAASYTHSSNASIIASEFTFYVVENAAATYGIVSSNNLDLGTNPITVSSASSLSPTLLTGLDLSIVKVYSNSFLRILFSGQFKGSTTSTEFDNWLLFYLFMNLPPTSANNNFSYISAFINSTGLSAPTYGNAPIELLISPGTKLNSINSQTLTAGTVYVVISAFLNSGTSNLFLPALSSLVVEEVLPISGGGVVQEYNIYVVSTSASITLPYSATKSPQYSQTTPIFDTTIFTRSSGGYMQFSGTFGFTGATSASQLLLCFYNSSDPAALPFAVRAFSQVSTAVGNSVYINNSPFSIVLPTVEKGGAFPVYASLASLRSPAVSINYAANINFAEIFIGNILVSGTIDTIETPPSSYLTVAESDTTVTIDTIQASSTSPGLVAATTAFPANSLVQIEASGAVPCEITSSNGTIIVISSSGSIDIVGAFTAASGAVDIYSPVSFSATSIANDIPITVDFTSTMPPLSAMQIIATGSVTGQFAGTELNSVVQCDVVAIYSTVNTSELGAQFCLYASNVGVLEPLFVSSLNQQGACSTNSYDNSGSSSLSFQVPSVKGQQVTFTLAASKLAGTSVTIEASTFSMLVQEVITNTQSIVDTSTYPLEPLPISVTAPSGSLATQTFDTTDTVITGTLTKQYDISFLQIFGSFEVIGDGANEQFWGVLYLYVGAAGLVGLAPLNNYTCAGKPGTGSITDVGQGGIGSLGNIAYVINSSDLSAGNYQISVGAVAQTSAPAANPFSIVGGSLIVNEILPLANGGILQSVSFPQDSIPVVIPYVTTTSPTFVETALCSTISVSTRVEGSLCYLGMVYNQMAIASGPSRIEAEVQLSLYDSNSPSAVPIASYRYTSPLVPNGVFGGSNHSYRYYFSSPAANQEITFYVGVTSLTSTVTQGAGSVFLAFTEVFPGNIYSSGIGSVTALSNSYITAQTTGSSVVISDIQASTSQAGLVALASATPANSLIQMGSSVPVACTLTSTDNSVVIAPASGTIDLSSPLNISTGTGAFGVVRSNNLNVASLSPNVAWNADYIVGGASSGTQRPIFDSTASFISAYTGSSSQLNLSEYTRFTATAASPPLANNTAAPQWIAVIQPLSVTLLQPKVIELIITPALLGALSTQAEAFSRDAYYRYVLGVNMTATGTPIEFNRMTLLPLESNLYGQTSVPNVADTPPWFTFDVVPAAGNPSGQFTTGNVLVVYAQWILSTVTGVTPQFNLAFRTLF